MKARTVLALVIALAILGGAGYLVLSKPTASTEATTYSWEFTDLGEDATGMPSTEVTLKVDEKRYPLGTFAGSCFEIAGSSWTLQAGEKAGVICWWAGGGEEIGLFEENGSVVVKKGQLDEGDAETPGFRGNFQTLIQL